MMMDLLPRVASRPWASLWNPFRIPLVFCYLTAYKWNPFRIPLVFCYLIAYKSAVESFQDSSLSVLSSFRPENW